MVTLWCFILMRMFKHFIAFLCHLEQTKMSANIWQKKEMMGHWAKRRTNKIFFLSPGELATWPLCDCIR